MKFVFQRSFPLASLKNKAPKNVLFEKKISIQHSPDKYVTLWMYGNTYVWNKFPDLCVCFCRGWKKRRKADRKLFKTRWCERVKVCVSFFSLSENVWKCFSSDENKIKKKVLSSKKKRWKTSYLTFWVLSSNECFVNVKSSSFWLFCFLGSLTSVERVQLNHFLG